LHVFHGGKFYRLLHIIYIEFECTKIDDNPHYLNMDDMKEIVSILGYVEDSIKIIFFCMSTLALRGERGAN